MPRGRTLSLICANQQWVLILHKDSKAHNPEKVAESFQQQPDLLTMAANQLLRRPIASFTMDSKGKFEPVDNPQEIFGAKSPFTDVSSGSNDPGMNRETGSPSTVFDSPKSNASDDGNFANPLGFLDPFMGNQPPPYPSSQGAIPTQLGLSGALDSGQNSFQFSQWYQDYQSLDSGVPQLPTNIPQFDNTPMFTGGTNCDGINPWQAGSSLAVNTANTPFDFSNTIAPTQLFDNTPPMPSIPANTGKPLMTGPFDGLLPVPPNGGIIPPSSQPSTAGYPVLGQPAQPAQMPRTCLPTSAPITRPTSLPSFEHGSSVTYSRSEKRSVRIKDKKRTRVGGLAKQLERGLRDEYLFECRSKGMTYKEIKRQGRLPGAESTLRGRYRTLLRQRKEEGYAEEENTDEEYEDE